MKTVRLGGFRLGIILSALVFLGSCSKPEVITPKPTPSVTLSASPSTSVEAGGSATISVTLSNATSWTASNGASGNGNGSFSTGPLNKETQFTVTATGPNGGASSSITITVNFPAPTVTLTATSQSIGFREKATINWSSTNGTTFVASWGGTIGASGTFTTGELLKDTTLSVTATGPGGTKKADVTIKVAAPHPTLALLAKGGWVKKEAYGRLVSETNWTTYIVNPCSLVDTLHLYLNGAYELFQTAAMCHGGSSRRIGSGFWSLINNQTQVLFGTDPESSGSLWTIVSVTDTRLEWISLVNYVTPEGVTIKNGAYSKNVYYRQ